MPGRLVHKADFERVLAQRPCGRSAHFALHHLAGLPLACANVATRSGDQDLSTGVAELNPRAVDDLRGQHWIGCVLPKRLARRAVTRNLLRRAIHSSAERCSAAMSQGLWVVRLRAPFSPAQYPSAASRALQRAARAELESLLCGSSR